MVGNSERVAEKHYLHVTDEHIVAGSTKSTVEKLGPKLGPATALIASHSMSVDSQTLEKPSFPLIAPHAMSGVCSQVGDEGLELLPFSAGSRAICVERDAESDAYLHEKVVVEQFKLLQPLFSSNLKQALISEWVGSLIEI